MQRTSKFVGDETKLKSRTISKEILKVNQWHNAMHILSIFNKDYTLDVVQIVESNGDAWKIIEKIIESSKDSHVVKVITPQVLMEFMNTVKEKPDNTLISHTLLQFAINYIQVDETYALTSSFFATLIKLKIIACHEEYFANKEMVKRLKEELQSDINDYSKSHMKTKYSKEKKEPKDKKKKKEKPVKEVKEKRGKKSKGARALSKKNSSISINKISAKPLSFYDVVIENIEVKHVYFILCGFYDSALIQSLNDLEINISAFIEVYIPNHVCQNPDDKFECHEEKETAADVEENVVLTANGDSTPNGESHRKISMELKDFWENWSTLKYNLTKLLPKDTCYIQYTIPTNGTNKEENFFFNELLVILHNISDLEICFKKYYEKVRYLNVEDGSKIAQLHCMVKYNALMDQMPNECITIPYLLDGLLKEVCAKADDYSEPHRQEVKNVLKKNVHGGTVFQIKKLLNKYDCSHYKSVQKVKIPRTISLSYGNVLYYTTGHLSVGPEIIDVTLNMLKQTIPMKLFELIKSKNAQNLLLYNYVFAKWSNQLANITMQQLMQAVYSFLFSRGNFKKVIMHESNNKKYNTDYFLFGVKEKYKNETINRVNMQLTPYTPLDENTLVDTSPSVFDSCQISAVENHYSLVEELDTSTTIQMINTAYNTYKHFDYKYFAPSDVVLIRFHHNTNEYGTKEERQKISLGTTICFRDFCSHFFEYQTSWFVKQLEEHLDEEILIKNAEEEERKILEEEGQKNIKCTEDFTVPGSFKEVERGRKITSSKKIKQTKSGKGKEKKGNKEEEVEDNEAGDEKSHKIDFNDSKHKHITARTSKLEYNRLSWINFARNSVADILQMKHMNNYPLKTILLSIPSQFSLYDSSKQYDFEIYNLGDKPLILNSNTVKFISCDGISASMSKDNWINNNIFHTFKIFDQHSTVVLQTDFKKYFLPTKPFYFHLNIVNGITFVFSLGKETRQLKTDDKKHVVEDEHFINMWNYSSTKETTYKSEQSDISLNTNDTNLNSVECLKLAIRKQIPIFKIISSRLHKYNYVKRIKSHLEFPVGNVLRRVICKPKLFQRLPKHSKKYTAKCIPFSDLYNKKKPAPGFLCKGTLSTGLQFQTRTDMSSNFYIKQKYIIDRKDTPSIKDEAYRCCIRNGVIIKFMKDGSIKTLSPDKSSCHYQFGFFSSNTRHSSLNNIIGKSKCKRVSRIVPLHAYTSNLSMLEKKIRYICNKYKSHLIDIADNYHFESSRLEHRNKQKIYKLSKKLHSTTSATIPILNQNVTTATGDMINIKNNKVVEEKNKYLEVKHKDHLTHETILHREDGVSWFLNKKGKTVTQFPDGSRISTWCSVLDENFLLEKHPHFDRNISLGIYQTKYSQTDERRQNTNPKKSSGLKGKSSSRNIIFSSSEINTRTSEEFILVGMNYKFEHPNYATVYYFCEKGTIDVQLPDNIKMTIYPEGSYAVKTINNSLITINNEEIDFIVNPANTSCKLDLSQLFVENNSLHQKFLYIKDSTFKEFSIDNTGYVIKSIAPSRTEIPTKGSTTTLDNSNKLKSQDEERLFVLKRNLSGQEYFREPIPYNFAHTLKSVQEMSESKAETNVLEQIVCTKILSPLKKNYSEHLMMLYDVPVLATSTEQKCMDKLWKIHDLDINCFITKREPRFIFKRVIFNLPSNGIMEEIATSVIKCIIGRNDNLPDLNEMRMYKDETEEHVKPVEKCVKEQKVVEKYIPKRLTCNKLTATYKQLIKNQKIAPYFKTLKGTMFTTIEKCSETAIKIGENNEKLNAEAEDVEPRKEIKMKSVGKIAPSNVKFQNNVSTMNSQSSEPLIVNVSAPKPSLNVGYLGSSLKSSESIERTSKVQNAYPGKLDVPKDLTIHLKPDSKVHEIILTAEGLKIITENDTQDYPFHDNNFKRASSIRKQSTNKQESFSGSKRSVNLPESSSGRSSLKISKRVFSSESKHSINESAIQKNRISKQAFTFRQSIEKTRLSSQLNELENPLLLQSEACEEFAAKLEGSFSSLPSWGNDNCIRKYNTPVTIQDPSCVNEDEDHKCSTAICYCPAPNEDTFCQMCTCPLVYCNCDDNYPWYSICALQAELNISEFISVVAWNTVITLEKEPKKLDVLETALERVIQSVIEDTEFLNADEALDLGKTIKYILKNKRKQNDVIEKEIALNILTDVVNEIHKTNRFSSDTQSALTKESRKELSDKIANVIIFSKPYTNKGIQMINHIIHDLFSAKITLQDAITTMKMSEEKINKFYAQKLPERGISALVLHAEICKEIVKWIKMVVDHIVDMAKCTVCKPVTRYTEEGPMVIPGTLCCNIGCTTKNNERSSLNN